MTVPLVRLQLLGPFGVRPGPAAADPKHGVSIPRKGRAILAYLALAGGRAVSRDKLAGLFWENSASGQARASLRQMLSVLRRALGADSVLHSEGDSVWLDLALVEADATAFEAAAAEGRHEAAAALFAGELLDGLAAGGLAADAWLDAERARLRGLATHAMLASGRAALAAGDVPAALTRASRLVALEPYSEPAHRLMMEALAREGRHAEALRQYRRLQDLLRRELGVAPDAESIALAREIGAVRLQGPDPAADLPDPLPAADPPPGGQAAAPTGPVPGRRELRRVAVLAAGLADFARLAAAVEVEALLALLLEWRAELETVAAGHGGRLHQQTGDEAILLFGDPVAHDDDAIRAAAAAAALHAWAGGRQPSGQPLAARAGIAVGTVLVSDGPPEPSAVGSAVAEAVALRAGAGPGETRAAGRHLPEMRGRIAILGEEPSGMVRLGGLLDGAGAPIARFVGRTAEMAQAEAMLAAVLPGPGQTLLVRGEAGIGKSRFVDMLGARARSLGYSVHRVAISEFGDGAAMLPRQQLARQFLGVEQEDLEPALQQLLERLGLPVRVRPFVHQLLGLPVARTDSAQVEAVSAEDASRIRGDILRRMLGDLTSSSPLMIAVDDIHWAGAGALRQLADLSRIMGELPALLVMTARPEPEVLDPAWRSVAGPLLTIDMRPLQPADCRTLADELGLGSVAELCVERSAGNPLFLIQLAAAVKEGVAPEAALPGTLAGLTLGRMDRLQGDDRKALRALAVLGRRSDLGLVERLTGVAGWQPGASTLGTLVAGDGRRFGLVHALVRDAIYASILPSERQEMHLAAAEAIGEAEPELSAEHLARADDPGAAAAWARAAMAALARHRPRDGIEAVERGEKHARTDADRFALALADAACRARLPDWTGSAAAARRALGLAGDTDGRLKALLQLAAALAAIPEAEEGLAVLAEAETLAENAPRILARIAALRGSIHFPRAELAECLASQQAGLAWSRASGSSSAEAGALLGLGWAQYQGGDFAGAVGSADACLALCRGPEMDRIRLSALRVRAVSGLFLLRHEAVEEDAAEAVAMAAAQHDRMNEVLARTTLATAHLEQFHPERALEILPPALHLARSLDGTGIASAPLWAMGVAEASLGQHREARAHLEAARVAAMRGPALRFAVPRILGTLAWMADERERAELLAEGEALLKAAPVPHSGLGFHSASLLACLVHGDWATARRCGEGMRRFAGDPPVPWAAPVIRMAELLPDVGEGRAGAETLAAAEALRAELRASRALAWLRPATRAVLEARESNIGCG